MPAVKGSEIRERRRRLGVKLAPFAELAGVKYKTLANIESGGQRFVSFEVIVRIARELPDTAPEDLLADEDAEAPCRAAGSGGVMDPLTAFTHWGQPAPYRKSA